MNWRPDHSHGWPNGEDYDTRMAEMAAREEEQGTARVRAENRAYLQAIAALCTLPPLKTRELAGKR